MGRNYDQIKKYIEADVNPDVRLLVSDFAILWNNYEKYLFPINGEPFYKFSRLINGINGTKPIVDKILAKIDGEHEQEIDILFNRFINYFEKKHGSFSIESFKRGFSVRKSDINDEQLIELINDTNIENKYLILMLMVGRVRNNMFHGIKSIGDLNNQKELFDICNSLLTLSLDVTNMLVF